MQFRRHAIMSPRRTPALEEAATGLANQERELVYYAKLAPGAEAILNEALGKEHHEQWELRVEKTDENASAGRFRVRKTVIYRQDGIDVEGEGGRTEYVLTSKTKLADGSGENEVGVPSSEAQFMQFKCMSGRGMIKTRYTFAIEGRPDKWEVDTFIDQKGDPSPWVKIDLEITDGNYSRPAFPQGLIDETTVISNSMKSTEIKDLIRELYDKVFITPNQIVFAATKPLEAPVEAPTLPAESETTDVVAA